MRASQPFANPGVGVSSFNFPKRPDTYRIIAVRLNSAHGSLLSPQTALHIADGAGNTIASWAGPPTLAVVAANYTFSSAPVDTFAQISAGVVAGQLINVAIPDDLWIQPQWTLQLTISPNNAADSMTNIQLSIEWFVPKVVLDQRKREAQDSPT